MTITGKNNYQLEGSEAGKWNFNIVKGEELLNEEVIEDIKNFEDDIYFNDLTGNHWVFDFKVGNKWAEAVDINCNSMEMDLIIW